VATGSAPRARSDRPPSGTAAPEGGGLIGRVVVTLAAVALVATVAGCGARTPDPAPLAADAAAAGPRSAPPVGDAPPVGSAPPAGDGLPATGGEPGGAAPPTDGLPPTTAASEPGPTPAVPGPPAAPGPAADPAPTGAPAAPGPGTGQPAATTSRTVGGVTDARGDVGLGVPPYADIVGVTVEEIGPMARFTVAVAGTVPGLLADGEVMGVGVDLHRTAGQGESDFQVFLAGNAEGWHAYLQNVNGLFDLPGTFTVEGTAFVLELDWAHLGQLPDGSLSAFVDWSRRRLPLNSTGHDRAPDRGAATFRR
jgi:hypothetical protein